MNSEQYMNSTVKISGQRLYSPNLRDEAVLESVQLSFYFFIHLLANWREKITDKCMEN